MQTIKAYETYKLTDECSDGYYLELYMVPPNLPKNHSLRIDFDDRSIEEECFNGSLWFRIYEDLSDRYGGHATFSLGEHVIICDSIEILPAFQRKGIGTAIYDLVEKLMETKITPSNIQSECGENFWESRQ